MPAFTLFPRTAKPTETTTRSRSVVVSLKAGMSRAKAFVKHSLLKMTRRSKVGSMIPATAVSAPSSNNVEPINVVSDAPTKLPIPLEAVAPVVEIEAPVAEFAFVTLDAPTLLPIPSTTNLPMSGNETTLLAPADSPTSPSVPTAANLPISGIEVSVVDPAQESNDAPASRSIPPAATIFALSRTEESVVEPANDHHDAPTFAPMSLETVSEIEQPVVEPPAALQEAPEQRLLKYLDDVPEYITDPEERITRALRLERTAWFAEKGRLQDECRAILTAYIPVMPAVPPIPNAPMSPLPKRDFVPAPDSVNAIIDDLTAASMAGRKDVVESFLSRLREMNRDAEKEMEELEVALARSRAEREAARAREKAEQERVPRIQIVFSECVEVEVEPAIHDASLLYVPGCLYA